MKTQQIKEAVKAIVDNLTCPLVISRKKVKEAEAIEYLESLPKKYSDIAYKWIERELDNYNTPSEDGYSAADHDEAMIYGY